MKTFLLSMVGQGVGVALLIALAFGTGWRCKDVALARPSESAPRLSQNRSDIDRVFHVLAQLESGGNPAAYNEREEAAGLYQIRPIYVADANRIIGQDEFSLDDRWSVERSQAMIAVYWSHYATSKRLGRNPTVEDLARIHNGGPNGWKKTTTDSYAAKFMELYNGYSF